MSWLLLYIEDGTPFDIDLLHRTLAASEYTRDLDRSYPHYALWCEYHYGCCIALIHASPDRRAVFVEGIDDAGLAAALTIQRGHGGPIRVLDDQNSFDLLVSEMVSLDDFRSKVEEARAAL